MARYRALGFDDKVDFDEVAFKRDANGRCLFFREDGLCNMVLDYGEECLCYTCHMYPRHIEEFEDVREYSLSMSCPEVSRAILSAKFLPSWQEIADDEPDPLDDYDDQEQWMYELLVELRDRIFAVLQQHQIPLKNRCGFFLSMVYDFQERIDNADMAHPFDMDEFLAEYDDRIAEGEYGELRVPEGLELELFNTLNNWEFLDDKWRELVSEAAEFLAREVKCAGNLRELNAANGARASAVFEMGKKLNFTPRLEQIIWYFIYTYFCGSIYDEYYYGQAQLAVVAANQIYGLVIAASLKRGEPISFDEINKLTYHYSRELEHSDYNLTFMEHLMDEMPIF